MGKQTEFKIVSIGQHDAKMVRRLCEVVANQWVSLHRHARSEAPSEVKDRLLEILGGGVFEWCWAVLSIYQHSFKKNDQQSIDLLFEHLCEPSVRSTICNKVCFSVSMIAARMRTISILARRSKGKEAKQLWRAYNLLFGVIYELLETGSLAEMPNSARCARMHDKALDNMVAVLPKRWEILKKHSVSSRQINQISSLLGQTLQLPIFEGIKAQEQGRVEPGPEHLRLWYLRPKARLQRGFYAELGSSVHELSQIAKQLRDYRSAAPRDTPRWECANAALGAVENTMIEVLGCGALYHVP